MKKPLVWVGSVLAALLLSTAVALYLVARVTLAPAAGEWATQVKLGPTEWNVGVPTVIRLATSPWLAPYLTGHTVQTRHGPVELGWNKAQQSLQIDCAPCEAQLPALGKQPLSVARLHITARRDVSHLYGQIEALPVAADDGAQGVTPLHAQWDGTLSQTALHLSISTDDAPIARWYAVLAPQLPELAHARIGGTLALRVQAELPQQQIKVQPTLTGFTVEGLGTEAMLNANTSCGPASHLADRSWLARAVIAAEDQRFMQHPGYDLTELGAAFSANQKASAVTRGASTLTQQLARLVATGGERSATRKLRELLYAVEMEQTLGKARILTLYLDSAPWGAGHCGAEAASRAYFKRPATRLEPAQAVWLAAMLHKPDGELAQWRATGHINTERAQWVADGIRGISPSQRAALRRSMERTELSPP